MSAARVESGSSGVDALAAAFARGWLVLAVISAAGIGLTVRAAVRSKPPTPLAVDRAAAAAATTITLPTPAADAPERISATA